MCKNLTTYDYIVKEREKSEQRARDQTVEETEIETARSKNKVNEVMVFVKNKVNEVMVFVLFQVLDIDSRTVQKNKDAFSIYMFCGELKIIASVKTVHFAQIILF